MQMKRLRVFEQTNVCQPMESFLQVALFGVQKAPLLNTQQLPVCFIRSLVTALRVCNLTKDYCIISCEDFLQGHLVMYFDSRMGVGKKPSHRLSEMTGSVCGQYVLYTLGSKDTEEELCLVGKNSNIRMIWDSIRINT